MNTITRAKYDELNARALAGPSRFLSSYHPEPYYWLSFDRKSPGLVLGYIEGEPREESSS